MVLILNLFKVACPVLAYGTDKIRGQGFSLVDIAANTAAVTFALHRSGWLGLDMLVIIRVCKALSLGKYFSCYNVSEKHGMGAKVNRICHPVGQVSVCVFREVNEIVFASFYIAVAGELVGGST